MTVFPGRKKPGPRKVSRLKRLSATFPGPLMLFLATLALLPGTARALINDPVANRTFIKPYGAGVTNEHTSFDMSILDGTSLVQADGQATYFLGKQSSRSLYDYQFVRANHTSQVFEMIYPKIELPGYTTFGMCINNGQLDYIIAIDDASGEIRVMRLKMTTDNVDPTLQMAVVKDYKVIDKNETLILKGNLYVHCQYDSSFKGVNTYYIGILGSYFQSTAMSNYYYAKFSTKYNLTEYFIQSQNPLTMEIPRKVYVDIENRRVYLTVEVNKNRYNQMTVYAPGAQPGEDNSNVAIICYEWTHATLLWTSLLGSPVYSDVFVDLTQFANDIFVVINSVTSSYSDNADQTDINYYRLRSENGVVKSNQVLGSPGDDKALNLGVSFNGVYIYALIQGPFLPHRDVTKQWQIIGNLTNMAMIQLDFSDQIIDIEAQDYSNPQGLHPLNPYPMRFFLVRSNMTVQNWIFVCHRSNEPVDRTGGILLSYYNNITAPFQNTRGCGSIGCMNCSLKVSSYCFQCLPGYELYNFQCYQWNVGATPPVYCPQSTYPIVDINQTHQGFCQSCHYSCKNCNGPKQDQCTQCCMNGDCGATNNREPNLGKCLCPTNTAEVNGICNVQCTLDFLSRRDQLCMTQCPSNSYAKLGYDAALAQESTQYDPSSPSSKETSVNHLSFTLNGQGVALPGPPDLEGVNDQFMIAFWVLPKALNTLSFFVNAFDRIQIYTQSSNSYVQYKFITGLNPATQFVQPAAPTPVTNQALSMSNQWNYVAVSQRTTKTLTQLFYEIQVGVAQGFTSSVVNAGYTKGSIPVVKFGDFKNIIFIGAQDDVTTQTSFSGYLKEFQLYTNFRGLAQMNSQYTRSMRLYSFDDRSLVAYWKLSEKYTSADEEYEINDYSFNQNSITYSKISKPSYPQFVVDQSNAINLKYIHDIQYCLSLDYSNLPPVATSSRNYIRLPTLDLREFTRYSGPGNLLRQQNDMLFYVPQNTPCTARDLILANMNYTYALGIWQVTNDSFNPMYLLEGYHYQLCYYIAQEDAVFNLAQVYIAARPRTVDPSNSNIYNRTGNTIQFMTGMGDQGFGDVLRLARDCDNPSGSETEFVRSNVPDYLRVEVTSSFNLSGTFYFCWYPIFTNHYLSYPIYDSIHNLYWQIQYEPVLDASFLTKAVMNQDMVIPKMKGTFIQGDMLTMAWPGYSYSDCNPANFMGDAYTYNSTSWPGLWLGYHTGIHGIQSSSMDELQMCWKPSSNGAPSVYIRIKHVDGSPYQMRLFNYGNVQNQRCPELVSFDPPYGSSLIRATDRVIKFNFNFQTVIPCRNSAAQLGMIKIFRGAVKADGTYVKIPSSILWQNVALDENTKPDPLQQGDLICTQTGQCSIILSQKENMMKAGEIYYLSFYPFSFMTMYGGTKYYLFNDQLPYGTAAYDHFFMCRSFDIFPSNQLINGDTVIITGVDLRSKVINAMYSASNVVQATFYTKAINLILKIFNTDQSQCIQNPPTATVAMEDVFDNYFVLRNLQLRECNSGQLFADIQFVRGIRDTNADYSYIKTEFIYNIQIGSIGCDPSCSVCNGTLDTNCMICSQPGYNLFMGKCYPQCPPQAPYVDTYKIIYHNLEMTQDICTAQCPFGSYSDASGQCVLCNANCQTCQSSTIASCDTCNPIMYLFNGLCVEQCPSPHHVNNFTDYTCHQVSQPTYLQVKILPLGFMTAIPKDKVVYLKAEINNTGGGNISSIQWKQLDTTGVNVFGQDADGTHNSSYQLVRLDQNSLMKFGYRTSALVQVTVTNTKGEIAYDLYEFFLNNSPFIGKYNIMVAGNPTKTTISCVDDLIQVNLINWYDSPDDTVQMLQMKIHLIIGIQVGTIVQSQQFTVTDQVSDNTLYFRIPPLYVDMRLVRLRPMLQNAADYGLANVTYCVSAIDMFNARTAVCNNLKAITNKMQFLTDYSQLLAYLQTLSYASNITNILYASSMIYQAVQSPARPQTQPFLCTQAIHCNMNGQCVSKQGVPMCQCDQGYFGTYCDFKGKELPNLRQLAKTILDSTYSYATSKDITEFDIEIIANVVRSMLNHPDAVEDATYTTVLNLLEIISSADVYAHQPYDTNITNIVMEAYAEAQLKISHSFKVRRAMTDSIVLGSGVNLLNFANSFTVVKPALGVKVINSDANYFTPNKASGLIGGVKNPRATIVANQQVSLNATLMYQNWNRRWSDSFEQYCQRVLYKMDPLNNNYIYRHTAFEVQLMHRQPSQINGIMYIKSKDSYWEFPPDLFDMQPGVASNFHEIKFKMMKNIMHPFMFEAQPGAFLESNVTTVKAYSLNGSSIPLQLPPNSKNFIKYKEPYNTTSGYNDELLRCMNWNSATSSYVNNQDCTFSTIWEVLQCPACNIITQVNTTISVCRCKQLTDSMSVTAFKANASTFGAGTHPGIYTDFYAMGYWQESFGYMATLVGILVFAAGHVFIWLIDGRLRRNLVIRLREKARNFELKHGAMMHREDGLFLRMEVRQKFIMQAPPVTGKKTFKEGQEEVKEGDPALQKQLADKKKAEAQEKKRKKTLGMKKKLFEDEDDEEDSDDSDDEELIKHLKMSHKAGPEGEEEIQRQLDRIKAEREEKMRLEEEAYLDSEEEDQPRDVSVLTPEQKEQYERHDKVHRKIKDAQNKIVDLYHELLRVRHDQVEGMTQNEFRKHIMGYYRKLPEIYHEDVKRHLMEIKGQLYSTDEELFRSLASVFEEMRDERERIIFRFKNMIIHGSHLISLFLVTSILSPRHIRWTLTICNITMLWFICAVYFNNTQDPLVMPDFNTSASSLAVGQLWIAFVAPIGSMILMFVVAMVLKMPNSQFVNVVTLRQLEVAVIEYRKEQFIRFFMGYVIVGGIMAYIFYYIITFTAKFGWKTSWVWYYTGIMAIFMQFLVYDTIVSFLHWFIYRRSQKLGRICQAFRSISQGYNEAYDLSSGEEEAKRIEKEMEVRRKKLAARDKREAAKQKKQEAAAKKRKKKKGGMFGETVGGDGGFFDGPPADADDKAEDAVQEFREDDNAAAPVQGSGSDNNLKGSGHDTAEDALNNGDSSGSNQKIKSKKKQE